MKNKKDIFKKGGWLLLGLLFQYLSGGDQPLGLAVWLTPVFILRFFRETGAFKAFFIVLPTLTAVNIMASQGMTPFPSFKILVFVTLNIAVWTLLPYLLDRLFYRFLPGSLRIFLFPALVITIPFLRSTQGTWFHIANTLNDLAFLQVVSVAGISGISFLIHWTATVANEAWEHRKERKAVRNLASILIGTLIFIYGFGIIRLSTSPAPSHTFRAAGIIPSPASREKLLDTLATLVRSDPQQPDQVENLRHEWKKIFHNLLSDSVTMAQFGFDIAVWPEGAAVVFEDEEQALVQLAAKSAKANHLSIGLSVVVFQNKNRLPKPGIQPVFKNKLILISSEGTIEWEHGKSYLAPGMEAAVTIAGDRKLKAGTSGSFVISGAICYEMDFPRYIRQLREIEADLVLAPSNDWTEIKNMHARMARLRAIENGVSLFRPTSGGISIAVDQYGRILSHSDHSLGLSSPMTAVLPVGRVFTLYAAWGEYFHWVCTLLSLICLIFSLSLRFKKHI